MSNTLRKAYGTGQLICTLACKLPSWDEDTPEAEAAIPQFDPMYIRFSARSLPQWCDALVRLKP